MSLLGPLISLTLSFWLWWSCLTVHLLFPVLWKGKQRTVIKHMGHSHLSRLLVEFCAVVFFEEFVYDVHVELEFSVHASSLKEQHSCICFSQIQWHTKLEKSVVIFYCCVYKVMFLLFLLCKTVLAQLNWTECLWRTSLKCCQWLLVGFGSGLWLSHEWIYFDLNHFIVSLVVGLFLLMWNLVLSLQVLFQCSHQL